MNTSDFIDVLTRVSEESLQVIDSTIPIAAYVSIDLSSLNVGLEHVNVSSANAWERYIDDYLASRNASVAFGGYLEKRDIYRRSSYFNQEIGENERNIHMGVDLWCKAGTKVLAVLDGEIHSFQNNTKFGDYGPTVILKHTIDTVIFYSLYGHLSLDTLANLNVGTKIKKGTVIGFLGDRLVNGDYAPHLHFQLIRDMEDNFGDYPGVSSKSDFDFYKQNCPDPNVLLKLG